MPPPSSMSERPARAGQKDTVKEQLDTLSEIAVLLNTGLDRQTLGVCVSMIEKGVNPDALSTVIKELRKEGAEAKQIAREG